MIGVIGFNVIDVNREKCVSVGIWGGKGFVRKKKKGRRREGGDVYV